MDWNFLKFFTKPRGNESNLNPTVVEPEAVQEHTSKFPDDKPPNNINRTSNIESKAELKSHLSLRSKAFLFFNALGMRPLKFSSIYHCKPETAFRYYQQWKRLPRYYEQHYALAKRLFHHLSHGEKEILMLGLAINKCTSLQEIQAYLQTPWAIKQLISGKWTDWPTTQLNNKEINKLKMRYKMLTPFGVSKNLRTLYDLIPDPEDYVK